MSVAEALAALRLSAYESGGERSETIVSEKLAELIKYGYFGRGVTYEDLWPKPCENQGVWLAWNDHAAFRKLIASGRCSQGILMRFEDALSDTEVGWVLEEAKEQRV